MKAAGAIDPIDWGNGIFQLKGRTTDKAQFSFDIQKNAPPAVFIDGKISLLGISSETTVIVDGNGFEFTTTGKIGSAFEATLEGKGKSFTQSGGGIYVRAALRNDLVAQLNQMVTGKINEAIQTTKSKLQGTRNELLKAQNDLKYIDDQIAQRTIALQGQKAADVQKIRNEALRAMNEQQAFINTCMANNAASQKRINELVNWYDAFEKAGLYTAITANNAAIESAKVSYAGYLATVNTTADVVEVFPNDPVLLGLYAERLGKQAGLKIALAGVDVAEGVSVGTLEATKYIMDKALGGVFDVKSAEFAGTFGLNSEYKINAALNFTLANNPYNMVAELDFNNLAASAGKIATAVLGGTLIKPGFAKTFATELKKPVSNVALTAPPVTISAGTETIKVVKPADGQVVNGVVATEANSKMWEGKYFRIENLWKTGQRLNVEKEVPVTTIIQDGAWSAQWIIKPVPGTNYFWIENRWRKGERLNAEKELPTVEKIQDGAWSAHWEFKKIGPNLYRIENRWKVGSRLHMENGRLECAIIQDGANSAMWYILSSGIVIQDYPPVDLKNPATYTGKFLRIESYWKNEQALFKETDKLQSALIKDGAWSAQWLLIQVPGTNYYWIENRWKKGERLNVENEVPDAGQIKDGAWSAHWELKKVADNIYRIENRWKTGQCLHIENGKLECASIQTGAFSSYWTIKVVDE